ncbi:MAG: DUF4087 domain-containing protein [Casimicrobium sp.]
MSRRHSCLALLTSAALAYATQASATSDVSPHRTTKPVNRCGWFSNPTPSNAWLTDRDGQWIIASQGGHQADGDWPTHPPKQWVNTNTGSYGYGCACVKMIVRPGTRFVETIVSTKALPLARCRNDKLLRKPVE